MCFFNPGFKYSRAANVDDDGNVPKIRQKRFIYFLCMNYPDCCDFRGKDVCGYPCPVCPKKKPPVTDGCKDLSVCRAKGRVTR
jgi:hypothetical protein